MAASTASVVRHEKIPCRSRFSISEMGRTSVLLSALAISPPNYVADLVAADLGSLTSVREEPTGGNLVLAVIPAHEQDLGDAVFEDLGVVEEVSPDPDGLPRYRLHGVVEPQTFERTDAIEDVEDAPVPGVVLALVLLEVLSEVVDVGDAQLLDPIAVSRRAIGILEYAQHDRARLGLAS